MTGTLREIIIHSDGACSGNPGPGGWSACLELRRDGGTERVLLRGGAPETTNNVMEMTGAANGLAYAIDRVEGDGVLIRLRSDSEYVLKGLTDWSAGWQKRGWRTASGDPVKNRDLWERLVELRGRACRIGRLELTHVRGHSGDPGNEAADAAAVAARDLSRSRSGPWADPPLALAGDPEQASSSAHDEAAQFEAGAAERGYRRYQDPFHHRKGGYLFSMQLRVREGADTRYFVNVDAWDMGAVSRGQDPRLSLEASVQFNTADGHDGAYVNVKTPFEGFEETEAFFARMWSAMGFGRYERAEPDPGPGA